MKKHYYSIDLLKLIACLLITNSHCGKFYPSAIFAFGGSQGNTLFFFISGLLLGVESHGFINWNIRKITRLFSPAFLLFFVLPFVFAFEGITVDSFIGYILLVINRFWFIFVIAIYYPICYFIKGKLKLLYKLCFFGFLTVYYIVCYTSIKSGVSNLEDSGFTLLKLQWYIVPMITGMYISDHWVDIINSKSTIYWSSLSTIIIIIWGFIYIVCHYFNGPILLESLLPLINTLFGVTFSCLILHNESSFTHLRDDIKSLVCLISSSTLEIYLVQVSIVGLVPTLPFPCGILIFFALALLGGILYHKVICCFVG